MLFATVVITVLVMAIHQAYTGCFPNASQTFPVEAADRTGSGD